MNKDLMKEVFEGKVREIVVETKEEKKERQARVKQLANTPISVTQGMIYAIDPWWNENIKPIIVTKEDKYQLPFEELQKKAREMMAEVIKVQQHYEIEEEEAMNRYLEYSKLKLGLSMGGWL